MCIFLVFSCRNQDGYEFNAFSDEEMEEENEYYGAKSMEERHHLVENTIHRGDNHDTVLIRNSYETFNGQSTEESLDNSEATSYTTPAVESSGEEEILARDTDSSCDSEANETDPTPRFATNLRKTSLGANNDTHEGPNHSIFNIWIVCHAIETLN